MPRNPCSYLPRRLQIVASLTAFILFCILFLGSSSTSDPYLKNVPYGPQIQESAHHIVDHLPKDIPVPHFLNPLRAPVHTPPPEQANSSSGDIKWFSDFKWRNVFSSSVTLDDERAVLPPLKHRPPVYTYFDSAGRRKDEKSKNAENELLQIWRRAWWAQGFKPIVLGNGEAMNNPLYRRVQALQLKPEMETEMMRWLAWGNMGTGILCNWLAVPMAKYDDPLLSFLRRGEFPTLTRYEGLENGLFVGTREDIDKALKIALDSKNFETASSIAEAVPPEVLIADPEQPKSIAFYSLNTIATKYKAIHEKLKNEATRSDGLAMLPLLINSHLHMTWQNRFTSGIAVLKPLAQNTTSMIEPAIDVARNLSQCAETPIPASCPPNRPRCQPCVSSQPMLITTPPVFRNSSKQFAIATVPHPYTLQSLLHSRDDLNPKYIRRDTLRDVWILAATKELLGTGISSFARLAGVKDAVASDYGVSRSLWITAERPFHTASEKDLEELDWIFGFQIPRTPMKDGKSETPVPGPERRPPPPKQEFDGPVPAKELLAKQTLLLEKARTALTTGDRHGGRDKARVATRDAVEMWNLADTEAWKFVRAFNARRTIERRKFEEVEEAFLGKATYERWKDYMTGD